jgi:putative ABC transport system substrate-binding protein
MTHARTIGPSSVLRSALAAVALVVGGCAVAQTQSVTPPEKVYRIGIISPASPTPQLDDAFRQGLRELGYIEGRNVVIETRHAHGRTDRLPELVAELIRLKVDVLVSGATSSVLAAKQATSTVPIVFATVFDPVGAGVVSSLSRPGGNVTGLAIGISGEGFGGKWVQLLKDVVPGLSRVSVLWSATNSSSPVYLREVREAARSLNLELEVLDAGNAASLDRALASIDASRTRGVIVIPDPFFHAHRARLVQHFESKRLPAIYFSKLFADSGGLMSYGASFEDSWRRAAVYVDKILKGTRPGDLPIEQPKTFELALNLQAAKALGLTVPPLVMQQADHILK